MRDTIFISHATPEDNEFIIWLASRLELLGYKVWIDKKELLGGEVFWADIEDAIRNKAIKFLLVYSKSILNRSNPNQLKWGIQKEIDIARDVIKLNPELKDFFTILHIDDSPYNLFPGSEDLNQIPFSNNWAEGLGLLKKKLEKDAISKSNSLLQSNFSEWYLDHYLIKNPIVEKKELYYTNWWSVDHLPSQFYIYRFNSKQQAEAIHSTNANVLATRNANCVVTFEKSLLLEIIHENEIIKIIPTEIHTIKVSELLLGFERDTFPTQRDAENYFKKLLKRTIHILFRKKKLNWYELANKNLAYYHTIESLPTSKVRFDYPFSDKKKTKNLYGKYLTVGKWHFAISLKPILKPYLGFSIKSHLVFTTNGIKTLDDKDLIHSYRRKKGKRMFNEEWRDLLLGFLYSFRDHEGETSIEISTSNKLIMKKSVETFWSDFGYTDPNNLDRQDMFIYDFEELEEEMINTSIQE